MDTNSSSAYTIVFHLGNWGVGVVGCFLYPGTIFYYYWSPNLSIFVKRTCAYLKRQVGVYWIFMVRKRRTDIRCHVKDREDRRDPQLNSLDENWISASGAMKKQSLYWQAKASGYVSTRQAVATLHWRAIPLTGASHIHPEIRTTAWISHGKVFRGNCYLKTVNEVLRRRIIPF